MIHAIPGHRERGSYMTLINHDDGNTYTLKSCAEFWNSNMVKGLFTKGFMMVALIGCAVFFVTNFLFPSVAPGVTFCALVALVAIKYVQRIRKGSRGIKLVTGHMNKIKNWVVQQG